MYSIPLTSALDTVKETTDSAKKDFESIKEYVSQCFVESTLPQPKGLSESRMWEICQSGGWLNYRLKKLGIPEHGQHELTVMHGFITTKTQVDPWVVAVDIANTVGNNRRIEFKGCVKCLIRSMGGNSPPSLLCTCSKRSRRSR